MSKKIPKSDDSDSQSDNTLALKSQLPDIRMSDTKFEHFGRKQLVGGSTTNLSKFSKFEKSQDANYPPQSIFTMGSKQKKVRNLISGLIEYQFVYSL